MKIDYIYNLYTQKVKQYLDEGMTLARSNVSIGGLEAHTKLTDGKAFYSVRIENEYLNSITSNEFGEFNNRITLKVIRFTSPSEDFEDNGEVLDTQDFYYLGNLLYTTTEALQLNKQIRAKRMERYEAQTGAIYATTFTTGALDLRGFKRGENTIKTWITNTGLKRRKVSNSNTRKSMTI